MQKFLQENLLRLPPVKQAILLSFFLSFSSSSTLLITESVFLMLLRVQLPMYFDFDDRVTYQVQLTAEACAADICLDNNIIGWYRASPNLHTTFTTQKLFGPEMLLLLMEVAVKTVTDANISLVAIKNLHSRQEHRQIK